MISVYGSTKYHQVNYITVLLGKHTIARDHPRKASFLKGVLDGVLLIIML